MMKSTPSLLFRIFLMAAMPKMLEAGGDPYHSRSSVASLGGGAILDQVYSGSGSIGGLAGTAVETLGNSLYSLTADPNPGVTADTVALKLSAADRVLAENTSTSLDAFLEMDDGLFQQMPISNVSLSTSSSAVSEISADGTVVFGKIYENQSASISASIETLESKITFWIIDFDNDDFGTYAHDGLDDSWQVSAFGIGNLLAKPDQDPDGDGQNNLFEYVSGLSPMDRNSSFRITLLEDPMKSGAKIVEYGPVKTDRIYRVLWSSSPAGPVWTPLSIEHEQGSLPTTRTVRDLDESATRRFYKVEVTRP